MSEISKDARAVLHEMQSTQRLLVGSIADYGKAFNLEHDGTWDIISFDIANELISAGLVEKSEDRGNGRKAYRAVAD